MSSAIKFLLVLAVFVITVSAMEPEKPSGSELVKEMSAGMESEQPLMKSVMNLERVKRASARQQQRQRQRGRKADAFNFNINTGSSKRDKKKKSKKPADSAEKTGRYYG